MNTYPTSSYDDLGKVVLSLGIGEAIVTVMNERGAPTPVAWTRLRAPQSLMGPADPASMTATVTASSLHARYAEAVDRESARELLAARLEAGAAAARQDEQDRQDEQEAKARPQPTDRVPYPEKPAKAPARRGGSSGGAVQDIMRSPVARDLVRTAAREIVRGVFGVGRRRR